MYIAALSRVQQRADIVETKTAMDTGVKSNNQMIKKTHIDARNNNIGQNLAIIADNQIDKEEELHKQQNRLFLTPKK